MEIIPCTSEHLFALQEFLADLRLGLPVNLTFLRSRTLGDPTCEPDLLLLAHEDGQIVGSVLGCVRGEMGVVKLFGVAPAFRRRGIGSRLFDEIEARFRARGLKRVRIAGVGPNYFTPGVDVRATEAITFLMARGYETNRIAIVDMQVDLDVAPLEVDDAFERLAAQGIILRRAAPSEVEEIAAFARDAFNEAWQVEVLEAGQAEPPTLFAAFEGSRCIAFAAYDAVGPRYFGPTGTLPEYRQRGIGTALLRLCLSAMRARGDRIAHISWAGPVAFYARAVGAYISRVYWVFQREWA
ncbi:MAG: GNAT family N-acetyltransferase [Chloroflexi bacterium]|nr:GNAT family N-acetyltransferase [Chloroflexota bacterium]